MSHDSRNPLSEQTPTWRSHLVFIMSHRYTTGGMGRCSFPSFSETWRNYRTEWRPVLRDSGPATSWEEDKTVATKELDQQNQPTIYSTLSTVVSTPLFPPQCPPDNKLVVLISFFQDHSNTYIWVLGSHIKSRISIYTDDLYIISIILEFQSSDVDACGEIQISDSQLYKRARQNE